MATMEIMQALRMELEGEADGLVHPQKQKLARNSPEEIGIRMVDLVVAVEQTAVQLVVVDIQAVVHLIMEVDIQEVVVVPLTLELIRLTQRE